MRAIRHKEVIDLLSTIGLELVRQGKGSHAVYRIGNRTTVIPNHREISPGVIRDICRNLGIDKKLFNKIS